ncbi:MAG: T9SS type A sorting domain-containing protein, partial [Ignavibacteriaceae bacterium]|nr:T9SS type A sorting domain-containing protein [Ignavibacteriaceae bacterium]
LNMSEAGVEEVSNTSKILAGLDPGKNYYWRVRSKLQSGEFSNYSNKGSFSTGAVTSTGNAPSIPDVYDLKQSFPNPFNPSTIINYSIPVGGFVSLKVYDILGREIATLVDETQNAGTYNVEFNSASGLNGNKLTSGVYFYRLQSGDFVSVKKMVLLQ